MNKTSTNINEPEENYEWSSEHEIILAEWADKAICYRWLHARSHTVFARANTWFTIPVIIMSTITGTANFAQDRFPEHIKPYATMSIGAINIFAGILTTIQQFLKVSELNEAHRVSSISWGKFYRNIKVELSKSPNERTNVGHFLKTSKEEYDRLMETSPSISEKIIRQFNITFKTKMKNSPNTITLKKPEICDIIESTQLSIYKSVETETKPNDTELSIALVRFHNEMKRVPSVQELKCELDRDIEDEVIEKTIAGFVNELV